MMPVYHRTNFRLIKDLLFMVSHMEVRIDLMNNLNKVN